MSQSQPHRSPRKSFHISEASESLLPQSNNHNSRAVKPKRQRRRTPTKPRFFSERPSSEYFSSLRDPVTQQLFPCNEEMICICDPCGSIIVVIVYAILVYAEYVTIFHICLPAFPIAVTIPVVLVVSGMIALVAIAHLRTMLSNPGYVTSTEHRQARALEQGGPPRRQGSSSDEANMPDGWNKCRKCDVVRPNSAHHCSQCKRCIHRMDHHCPWVNNCVGQENQKYFILFNFYVSILSGSVLILLIASCIVVSPGSELDNNTTTTTNSTTESPLTDYYRNGGSQVDGISKFFEDVRGIHALVLGLISVLFLLFTIGMGCDQLSSLRSGSTAIDRLKARNGANAEAGGTTSNIAQTPRTVFELTFGSGNCCTHCLPISGYKPDVYQVSDGARVGHNGEISLA